MTSILFYITHAKSYYILQFKIKNIYLKNKKYFYDFLFVKLYLFVLDLVFKMSDLTNKSSSESENERRLRVRQEFLKLDKDRSGYLEVNELKQWLYSLAKGVEIRLSDEDVAKLIETIDKENKGKVSMENFVKLL